MSGLHVQWITTTDGQKEQEQYHQDVDHVFVMVVRSFHGMSYGILIRAHNTIKQFKQYSLQLQE